MAVSRVYEHRSASQMRSVKIYFFTLLVFWKLLFVLYFDPSPSKFVACTRIFYNYLLKSDNLSKPYVNIGDDIILGNPFDTICLYTYSKGSFNVMEINRPGGSHDYLSDLQ